MVRLANAIKSLAFQPRMRKKGNKSRQRGRWKTLLGAGTPDTPVFTKRRVFLSFSHSLFLTLLVHCHTGASRHGGVVRCVSRLTIYTGYEYANGGILLRARIRMIHVAPRSIYIYIGKSDLRVSSRDIRLLRDDIAVRES